MTTAATMIPTAPTSYLTLRRKGAMWQVQLVTPVGRKNLRTTLALAATKPAALEYATTVAKQQQRPLRLPSIEVAA
jgi:hypothetical protein